MQQRIGVCGIVIHEGKALVVRRSVKEEYFSGYFELPGGRVGFGEHPDETIIREVKEETGIDAVIIKQYGIFSYMHDGKHAVELLYLLKAVGSVTVVLSEEHDAYRWITQGDLAILRMTAEMKENIRKGFAA